MTRQQAKNILMSEHLRTDLIDEIYDSFEQRICKNCRFWSPSRQEPKILGACLINENIRGACSDDFGCNLFSQKD